MEVGPVQIVVIGLGGAESVEHLLPEVRRLREQDAIRLIDLVLLDKDGEGRLSRVNVGRRTPNGAVEFGDTAEALVGFGRTRDLGLSVGAGAGAASGPVDQATRMWAVSDAILPDTTAAVLLIEHRWAIPLRLAVARAGGFALEDTWVHPADVIATGAALLDPG